MLVVSKSVAGEISVAMVDRPWSRCLGSRSTASETAPNILPISTTVYRGGDPRVKSRGRRVFVNDSLSIRSVTSFN